MTNCNWTFVHLKLTQVYVLLRLAKDDDDRERTADLVRPVLKKDPRLASGISKQMFKVVSLEKLSKLHIKTYSFRFNFKPL
jgi:hypothetical protein